MSATSSSGIVAEGQRDCLSAALAYWHRGWSIVPMRMAEKRPAVKWSRYQHNQSSEASIRRWFANGEHGAAVVFGAVSGNLVSRDFDQIEAYYRWASERPELASKLPTVATARGRHVYCTAVPSDLQALRRALGKEGGTGAIHLADGELRAGMGCYSVLPPSRHPSGAIYRWEVPLPTGAVPLVDLFAAGFVESVTCNREHGENRGNGRLLKGTDAIDKSTSTTCMTDCPTLVHDVHRWPEAVKLAIADSLPIQAGKRHEQVFDLARGLKGVASLADADPRDLRAYVERWHELALPAIKTKAFEESWIDFLRGWERVKFPKGSEPMAEVYARAVASEVPEVADRYEQPALKLLVSLCRELQRATGEGPFFLSCRTAGRLLGVDHTTANRWLFLMVADGVLAEVEKGDRGRRRASRYRFDLSTVRTIPDT